MPVNYATPAADQLFPVAGVRLGIAEAEIRKKNRRDLTLVALDAGPKVGRNDPCPCGSGKKYKHCHGKLS